MELVVMLVSKASVERRVGLSPTWGTIRHFTIDCKL